VVWNNNSNINLNTQPTQSTKLSFYLPPKSLIPCCGLKATICVKFSLKDINCNLCEIVKCYEVVIGDTIVHESCCCENWNGKPVTIRKATIPVARENHDPTDISIKPYIVNCGDSISLTSGYYNITAPVFTCNPTTCNVSYTWTVTTKSLESEIADIRTNQGGPGNSFGFNFNIPGSYLVTFTPKCGSCKCEPCRFTVIIKK
jgi:hypothetical protein